MNEIDLINFFKGSIFALIEGDKSSGKTYCVLQILEEELKDNKILYLDLKNFNSKTIEDI